MKRFLLNPPGIVRRSICRVAEWPQTAAMVLLCGLVPTVFAQQVTYTYDLPGNPRSVTPVVAAAPVIIAQPTSELLRSNGIVTFSVTARDAGLNYQWFSNDIAIVGSTSDSLLLRGLTGTNFANYTVRVSNGNGAVTSAPPVTIFADSNANSLPDWWELQYFGNLNQKPAADTDGDGISNADEYREGTHPANRNSFNARLSIYAPHGTVLTTPNLPYYTRGEFVSLTAIPDPGWLFLDWGGDSAGTKTNVSVLMDTNKFVTARFGLPLPVALNHGAQWISGGDAQWFGQAEVSHDGAAAAQSGPIYSGEGGNFNGQQTWIQMVTNASHAIDLSFWWAVSSQPPDALVFAINGVNRASISGETLNWQRFTTNLPPDNYTFTWTYTKGPTDLPTGIAFVDSAWLDQVTIVSEANEPPALSILLSSGNTVLLSWPAPSTGFVLQQNPDLSSSTWINSDASVTVVGTNNNASISLSNAVQFFRLKAQ